jgi:hypothetical protein
MRQRITINRAAADPTVVRMRAGTTFRAGLDAKKTCHPPEIDYCIATQRRFPVFAGPIEWSTLFRSSSMRDCLRLLQPLIDTACRPNRDEAGISK